MVVKKQISTSLPTHLSWEKGKFIELKEFSKYLTLHKLLKIKLQTPKLKNL